MPHPLLTLGVWLRTFSSYAVSLVLGGTMISLHILQTAFGGDISTIAQVMGATGAIGIGAWATISFLRFKDTAVARAEADKLEAIKLMTETKSELLVELHKLAGELARVGMALSGYDGQGGLLEQVRDLKDQQKVIMRLASGLTDDRQSSRPPR